MLGCQSDRTTPPRPLREELFKLYYNIVRTYTKNPVKTVNHCFLTHKYLRESGFAEFAFVSPDSIIKLLT